MTDFRVKYGFQDHPKTVKLKRNLGPDAVLNLLRLFEFASIHRPKGILYNMDHEDIECAAKWEGTKGEFVQWLLSIRFLDCDGEWCEIHDWEEHNPWAYHSDDRRNKAKHAARMRWAYNEHKSGNAPSPTPNPSPNPIPKKSKDQKEKVKDSPSAGFSEDEAKCKKDIKKIAEVLAKKWPEVYKAVNGSIRNWKHPCAVKDALNAVYWYFDNNQECEPWKIFQAQLKIKSGNYWEKEHVKNVDNLKQEFDGVMKELKPKKDRSK